MAEVTRRIAYRTVDEGDGYEPVLIIEPKYRHEGCSASFAIRIDDLWMYSADHNPRFDEWMFRVVNTIYSAFGLGTVITSQRMAEVATVIEEGIDDLLKAPPEPPVDSPEDLQEKALRKFVKENVTLAPREQV